MRETDWCAGRTEEPLSLRRCMSTLRFGRDGIMPPLGIIICTARGCSQRLASAWKGAAGPHTGRWRGGRESLARVPGRYDERVSVRGGKVREGESERVRQP